MSSRDYAISSESTDTLDILQPTDLDAEILRWDGNNAKILGLLDATGKHYTRKGLFQPFFQHRAVLLSNGKISIPSKLTIPFLMGEHDDDRSFTNTNMCPVIADRVADADAQRILSGDKPIDWKTVTVTSDVIVNKLYSDQEDGKLLRSLTYVFGHADPSEELVEAASGSGSLSCSFICQHSTAEY